MRKGGTVRVCFTYTSTPRPRRSATGEAACTSPGDQGTACVHGPQSAQSVPRSQYTCPQHQTIRMRLHWWCRQQQCEEAQRTRYDFPGDYTDPPISTAAIFTDAIAAVAHTSVATCGPVHKNSFPGEQCHSFSSLVANIWAALSCNAVRRSI